MKTVVDHIVIEMVKFLSELNDILVEKGHTIFDYRAVFIRRQPGHELRACGRQESPTQFFSIWSGNPLGIDLVSKVLQ